MKDNDRAFVIHESQIGYKGGRYVAETAQGAAHHAARILFRKGEKKHSKITFSMRECTLGSKKKVYHYRAVIKPRSQPQTWRVRDNKTKEIKVLQSTHEIKVYSRTADE
jgi:hypothetical protein